MPKTDTVSLPRHSRAAMVRSSTFNADDNTIDVCFTTGADVLRSDFWSGEQYIERLECGPENVRLDRLNAGAAFLDTHNAYELGAMLGSVVPGSARMEGGQGLCKVKLSSSARAADSVRDIRDGIINNISVGYDIHAITRIEATDGSPPIMVSTDWEPGEISAVPVPADPGAQIRAATRSTTGVQMTTCKITRAEPQTTEAAMADDPKPADADKNKPAEKPADKPPEKTQAEKDAAEKAGLKPEEVLKAEPAPLDLAIHTEKNTEVVDPGDALPVNVQRLLDKKAEEAVVRDRTRAAEIRTMARKHGLGALGDEHAERGTSVQTFKDIVLEKLATRFAEGGPQIAATGEASLEAARGKESGADWAKRLTGKK